MTDRPIAFFDSGIGGLPYYERAAERLPAERFVYLADTAGFPYGEKTLRDLERIVVAAVGRLIAAVNPRAVVIACNTASVVALDALRRTYGDVPFVGVVPAVKPAAQRSRNRSIALFATARTVADRYTDSLIGEFAADCRVARVADGALVRFVERHIFTADAEQRRAAVASAAAALTGARSPDGTLSGAQVDVVVLGCTHFVYLAKEIGEALGEGVQVLDSRDGVCRQLERIVGVRPAETDRKRESVLYVTGFDGAGDAADEKRRYTEFAAHFGLTYGGVIDRALQPTTP